MINRTLSVRFDVYRNGVKLTELHPPEERPPRLMMRQSADIKTSLTGSFAYSGLVDYLTDEIRPFLIIDGVEHKLGVYLPATIAESDVGTNKTVNIEAYDRGWQLQSCRTETILHFSAGSSYLAAIELLLASAGIPLYLATPSAAVFQTDREDWPVGTDYLEIINALLSEINYKTLWFDEDGYAVLEPEEIPSAENLDHYIGENDVKSFLLPGRAISNDLFTEPNVFICVCDNPDLPEALVSVAENNNPQSPISTLRRGRRISTVIKVDNIADQNSLDYFAKLQVFNSLTGNELIEIDTALLPGFGVGDIVALDCGGASGICVDSAWTMELVTGGTMSHTLKKVVYSLDQF